MSENIKLTVDEFGTVEDHISKEQKTVKRFTWKNSKSNVEIQVRVDLSSLQLDMNVFAHCMKSMQLKMNQPDACGILDSVITDRNLWNLDQSL